MAITLNGSGSITGLSSGAGISASALSGQVPDANAPSGSVLQVVSATKTDTASFTNNNTFQDISGLSVSITPISSSSKILIMFTVYANNTQDVGSSVRLVRDSTAICVGATAGSRLSSSSGSSYRGADPYGPYSLSNNFVDSPASSSSITYKMQVLAANSSTTYINRSSYDTDAFQFPRMASTITVMEIAA